MSASMLDVRSIHKWFGDLHVLRGIDLEIGPGEIVSLLGPSGSGKSTLLRCVQRLETIDAGRIRVDGQLIGYRERDGRLHELPERDIVRQRASIGMVFQRFNLFRHMTAVDNVAVAPRLVLGCSKQEARERAEQLLGRVGLDSKLDAYPAQLSGGQQQRVAIARALAMRPKLMLFDEPTSALDPELVGEVLDVIRGLAADGMTMLIATHEIGFARDVCDRAVFMDEGVVLEAGAPSDVLTRPSHERTQNFLARVL